MHEFTRVPFPTGVTEDAVVKGAYPEAATTPFSELTPSPAEGDYINLDTFEEDLKYLLAPAEEADTEVDFSFKGFPDRLADSFVTFGHELSEKGHRARRSGAFILGAGTQGADRFRGLAWVLPPIFERVQTYGLEHSWNGYQMATASGVAIGVASGVWTYGVGKVFGKSMDAFPETTETVVENHPAMVGSISKAVNGFPNQEELVAAQPDKPVAGYEVGPYDTRKSWLGKVALGLVRGPKTALLFGATPHVGVAKVREHSSESTEKRLRTVSTEAGVVFTGIAAGLSGLMTRASFELAEQIKDDITNKKYLLIFTTGSIVVGAAMNYLGRHDAIKDIRVNEEADEAQVTLSEVSAAA